MPRAAKSLIWAMILALCLGCTRHSDKWVAALLSIPNEINSRQAFSNPVNYILTQTHEPIFRFSESGDIVSRILSKWNRSSDSNKLTLCPNHELTFTADRHFTVADLMLAVGSLNKRFKNIRFEEAKQCLEIITQGQAKEVMEELTQLEYSPSIPSTTPGIEHGLGRFIVTLRQDSRIELKRKRLGSSRQINEILILRYSDLPTSGIAPEEIDDFNQVAEIPPWVKAKYIEIPSLQLKEYTLLIDHPNRDLRSRIWNCLDLDTLKKIYFPSQMTVLPVKTLFPVGISGAVAGRPAQSCKRDTSSAAAKKPSYPAMTFMNWNPAILPALKDFFSQQSKLIGVEIKVLQLSTNEMISRLHRRDASFNLAVIASDTVYQEYLSFFEPYVDPKIRFMKFTPQGMIDYFSKARIASGRNQLDDALHMSEELSEKQNFVLPLGQTLKKLYFPRNVKNVNMGSARLEAIDISEIEVQ